MKKSLVILIVLAALLTAGWFTLRKLPQKADQTAVAEELVARAQERNIRFHINLTGDITPYVQVEIKPEVSGKVKKLYKDVGARVFKDDLIAEIDDADLQTERASALTDIEGAKLRVGKNRKNFDRAKELVNKRLITQEVFDNLEADLAISENDLVKSQRRLQTLDERISKTKVLAPADGTILAMNVIEGQVVVAAASVNSGTTLMMLADLNKLRIDSHVNQVDIGKIKLGQKLTFECAAVGRTNSTAQVTFIAPVANVKNNVKGFKIEAMIAEPDERLKPGLTVAMNLPIASAENAISIPVSAVFKDEEDNSSVVYVKKSGETEKRKVEVGVTDLFFAQITEGLTNGEEVLLVEPRS